MNFDPNNLKKDFPLLNQKDNGPQIVYLDSAATSQKPSFVIEGINEFYSKYNSNVYRSIYSLGENATTLYEQAREKIAKFLNALPEEIIFTSGTTEGINFIADAWAIKNILPGDQIVLTQVEHHANLLPWQRVAARRDADLKFINLNTRTFTFDFDSDSDIEKLINIKTKLVAINHTSNVLGDIWQKDQLEKIIKRAHSVGAKVLIDAAQSAPRQKIDVKKLDAEFLVFSGHKMFGPTGIGILYIKKDLHDNVEPYKLGGSMVYSVTFESATWKESPYKFEAGTPPIAQAIGLGYAIDYLNSKINFDELKKHEAFLCSALIDGLQKIDGVKILGDTKKLKETGHLVTFYVDGIHAHDLSAFLSQEGIAVRSGHHCAQPLANLLGVQASLRVSFYAYNTLQDVEIFLKEFEKAVKFFKTK